MRNRRARCSEINPAAWALPMLLAAYGCGGYSPEAHRVDPVQARTTLETALSTWQLGDSPDSLRQREPQIVVQDIDWMAGRTLEEFELLDEGEAVDANLYCRVRLVLADSEQSEGQEQMVTYIVTTSPSLTVFRSLTP